MMSVDAGSDTSVTPPVMIKDAGNSKIGILRDNKSVLTKIQMGRISFELYSRNWPVAAGTSDPPTPPGNDQPTTVSLETDSRGIDHWHRNFNGRRYHSMLAAGTGKLAGKLAEYLSAMTLISSRPVRAGKISQRPVRD